MAETQDYAAHRRYVPMYHFVLSAIWLLLAAYAVWQLIVGFSLEAVFRFLLVLALAIIFYYLRVFPLKAQDRLIRLEERLRLERRLPPDLAARAGELTADQLIALRFAADEELPDLVRRVLDEPLTDREAIKKQIRTWRPDTYRV